MESQPQNPDFRNNQNEPWHVISNNVAFWQVYTQTNL